MSRQSRNLRTILGPDHEFAIDGEQDSAEYGWRDMTADLTGNSGPGANPPSWAEFRDGMYGWAFAANVTDELFVTFHPNHDVIEGELFYPHIHWSPNTTSTGTVVWKVDITIAKGHDQEAFPAPTTCDLTTTISSNKQYQHIITECTDAQAIAMPETDSLIMIRVYREGGDAGDTFPDPVFGLTADIHYRAGKFFTKGKRPNFDEAD